ncbi:MAG: class I tRNA ligase family protein, partial [Thalassospira sp.]|nr:class I tRNA ligase family protein [Thalassospira sp.]
RSYWQDQKIYKFNPNTKKKIYSIDTPPPTVSGDMHIGHAFSYAQEDFFARYKRMAGFEVFYPHQHQVA